MAHLETFVETKYELMRMLKHHVVESEEKIRGLKQLIDSCDGDAQSKLYHKAFNASAAAEYTAHFLMHFTRVRKKQRALLSWFSDVELQRKRK